MAKPTSLQLAWLDANIHKDINREFWTRIREIYPEAKKFDDQDECLRFLGSDGDDPRRFVFIVSGILAEKLVPDLHRRDNILSIYVYCANISKHEGWSRQYEKVTVLTSAEEVLRGIKSDQKQFLEKHNGSLGNSQ